MPHSPMDVAVVTGAGSGLGRALALELGRRGARVVISDVDAAGLEQTERQLHAVARAVAATTCDVRSAAEVDALAAFANTQFGEVDLIANNAGIAVAGRIDEVEIDRWHQVIDVNLYGVIHGCKSFVPAMRKRRRGFVINVASAAGLFSMPKLGPYNVSKAGVVALSQTLHGEVAREGVHVSVLCPTFFQTNIAQRGAAEVGDRLRQSIERAMAKSKVQAPRVAAAAIDAVLRNQLYALPMADGRAAWRTFRLAPALFYRLIATGKRRG